MAKHPADPGLEWGYIPDLGKWILANVRIINGQLYDVSEFYDEKTEDNEIEFKRTADEKFARIVNG